MKKTGTVLFFFLFSILLLAQSVSETYRNIGYNYISPRPGSLLINPTNNIIIRSVYDLDIRKIQNNFITVKGSKSGNHSGKLILSDDNKTLVFYPTIPFELGETVMVILNKGSFSKNSIELEEYSFSFRIKPNSPIKKNYSVQEILNDIKYQNKYSTLKKNSYLRADSLPNNFPNLKISISNNPADGYFFLSAFNYPSALNNFLMIISNSGVPVFYRKMASRCYDFKVQSNGDLTYFDETADKSYELNSYYSVVDSFSCGNGYGSDIHDLVIIPSGHALLLGDDIEPYRMDTVVAGGDSNAILLGCVIQELDSQKNVIFQWRSIDHYKVTDASNDIDLTSHTIDYVHANAIAVDNDGNLLLSARHMDEITKINRKTGNIIWRLGGKNNEFTFINDEYKFSHQHDVRCWPNGDISLFDNGNLHSPPFSRAVEYKINDSVKTATLVWEYRHNPDFYTVAMGSSRELPNGNRVIGWGIKGDNSPDISEITPDGNVAFKAYLPDTMYSYRAFKFKWRTSLFTASSYNVGFGAISVGDSATLAVLLRNNSPEEISITGFYNVSGVFSVDKEVPFKINPGEEIPLPIKYKPDSTYLGSSIDTVYILSEKPGERVAQVITLSGESVESVNNKKAQILTFNLSQNYPNPFNPTTKIAYSIPKTSFVKLKVYDILGREVATLVDEEKSAGNYKVNFDGSNLTSGIYLFKIQVGNYSSVKKMILLK